MLSWNIVILLTCFSAFVTISQAKFYISEIIDNPMVEVRREGQPNGNISLHLRDTTSQGEVQLDLGHFDGPARIRLSATNTFKPHVLPAVFYKSGYSPFTQIASNEREYRISVTGDNLSFVFAFPPLGYDDALDANIHHPCQEKATLNQFIRCLRHLKSLKTWKFVGRSIHYNPITVSQQDEILSGHGRHNQTKNGRKLDKMKISYIIN